MKPLANACNEEALSIAQHLQAAATLCTVLQNVPFFGIAFDALPSEPYS